MYTQEQKSSNHLQSICYLTAVFSGSPCLRWVVRIFPHRESGDLRINTKISRSRYTYIMLDYDI